MVNGNREGFPENREKSFPTRKFDEVQPKNRLQKGGSQGREDERQKTRFLDGKGKEGEWGSPGHRGGTGDGYQEIDLDNGRERKKGISV